MCSSVYKRHNVTRAKNSYSVFIGFADYSQFKVEGIPFGIQIFYWRTVSVVVVCWLSVREVPGSTPDRTAHFSLTLCPRDSVTAILSLYQHLRVVVFSVDHGKWDT